VHESMYVIHNDMMMMMMMMEMSCIPYDMYAGIVQCVTPICLALVL
jgi:hypothetical protein